MKSSTHAPPPRAPSFPDPGPSIPSATASIPSGITTRPLRRRVSSFSRAIPGRRGLFTDWVRACPLAFTSPHAPALASRLSYLLWAGPPDEALLAAADKGQLTKPVVLRAQAERLLAVPPGAYRVEWFEPASLRPLLRAERRREGGVRQIMTAHGCQ